MMTGSAMRKPRIQPGRGSASADSMIDGRTIDTGTSPRCSSRARSPKRLGVGVGVGPAERRGPGPAGLDHAVLDPGLAALLGLGRQRGRAGGAQLAAGLGPEAGRAPRACGSRPRRRCAGPAGALDLGPPVDVDEERAVVHRLLGRRAPPVAGHVAGGHGDEVGGDAEVLQREGDAAGAEQVDLDRAVERRVEGDGGGRVDDDVARRRARPGRRRRGRGRRCRRRRR